MRALAVLPARYAAQRLPGKPLAEIAGLPMIQRVYENVSRASSVARVIVATDDDRIAAAVRKFGGDFMMTDPALPSGTDRVAVVAESHNYDVVVNVQGDEPLMEPEVVDVSIAMVTERGFEIGTAMTPWTSLDDLPNQAAVKVMVDVNGRAIYFSRFPVPYSRGGLPTEMPAEGLGCQRHLGLYAFRRESLLKFRSLAPTVLERGEVLEQLRALHYGMTIGVASVTSRSFGIDTPEDLARVRKIYG